MLKIYRVELMGAPGFSRRAAILALACVAAVTSVDSAAASCAIPAHELVFSYPAADGETVPPDAVLWLIPLDGGVTLDVQLDGVELPALGTEPEERFQFHPVAPMAAGEHELLFTISAWHVEDTAPPAQQRLRFTVQDAPPQPMSDVRPLDATRLQPNVREPVARECQPIASFTAGCDDTELENDVGHRVRFAAVGEPLFYVLNGTTVLPAGCESTRITVLETGAPVIHEIAAVNPTGFGASRAFPEARDAIPRVGCAIGGSQGPASKQSGWLGAAAAVALAGALRRRIALSRS